MSFELSNANGAAVVPEANELAAILAVLESLDDAEPAEAQPPPSRWRLAARSFGDAS